jgi:hypothetical protein
MGDGVNDAVTVRQSDLGLGIQPMAKLVGPNGFKTTIHDLLFRMIVDNDSAATDFLTEKVGGRAASKTFSRKRRSRDLRSIGMSETSMPRRVACVGTRSIPTKGCWIRPSTLYRKRGGIRDSTGPNVTTPEHRLQ